MEDKSRICFREPGLEVFVEQQREKQNRYGRIEGLLSKAPVWWGTDDKFYLVNENPIGVIMLCDLQ